MTILYLMVPIALLLAGAAVWAFTWSIRTGQYEDKKTPAMRLLWDDEAPIKKENNE